MGTARRRMRDEIVNSLARLLEQPEVFLLMATQPTQYAHPEALVETDWLEKHLNDESIRIVESNEDILLYDTGHIPGAVHIDWRADLQDPVIRDYISPEKIAPLCSRPRNWRRSTSSNAASVPTKTRSCIAESGSAPVTRGLCSHTC